MNPQHQQQAPETSDTATNPASMDKVRELLFGGQMRDFGQRFKQLDERIDQDLGRLREELDRRGDAAGSVLRQELDGLSERPRQERRDREQAIDALNDKIDDRSQQLSARLEALDERLAKEISGLRSQLHTQGQELSGQLARRGDELQRALRLSNEQLADAKLDRSDLAALFSEVSLRLNRELELPDPDADKNA